MTQRRIVEERIEYDECGNVTSKTITTTEEYDNNTTVNEKDGLLWFDPQPRWDILYIPRYQIECGSACQCDSCSCDISSQPERGYLF